MNKDLVYGFLIGLNIGGFSGIFSNFIFTGITLYIYSPEFYELNNINQIANTTLNLIKSFK